MQLRKDFISAKQDVIQQVRKYSSARLKEYRYLPNYKYRTCTGKKQGRKKEELNPDVRKLRERENRPDQLGMQIAYRLPPLLRTDVRKQ